MNKYVQYKWNAIIKSSRLSENTIVKIKLKYYEILISVYSKYIVLQEIIG